MDIYSGANPGTLLGTSTAVAGFGINNATFKFDGLVVPNTVTFVLSLPNQNGSYDSIYLYPLLTSNTTTVGSSVNSLWYGTAPNTFIANATYAVDPNYDTPGNQTNFIDAQFNANATPEPGFYGLLALGLSGLVTVVRRRKKA
jgi:hypothetical protein